MIDFSLTEEQKMLQKTARDFGENEIRPMAAEIKKKGKTTWRTKKHH